MIIPTVTDEGKPDWGALVILWERIPEERRADVLAIGSTFSVGTARWSWQRHGGREYVTEVVDFICGMFEAFPAIQREQAEQ